MARKIKQVEEVEEKQGKPWRNVAKFNNFCEADNKRAVLLSENDNIQVKVKRCGAEGEIYVVKSRKSHELEEEVERNSEKRRKNKKERT